MIDTAKIVERIQALGELSFNNKALCGIDTLSAKTIEEARGLFSFLIPLSHEQFKSFKTLFGDDRFCEYSLSLDIRAYAIKDHRGRDVLTIKQSQSKFTHNQRLTLFTVEYLDEKKVQKTHYVAKNKHDLNDAFRALRLQLPIQQIEEKLKRYYRLRAKPHPNSFWGKEWGLDKYTTPYSAPGGIDAVTVDTFRKHMTNKASSEALVLDVGGGKGRLADKLLREAQCMGIELHYVLIEPDLSQCEAAEALLKIYPQVVVFHGTLQDFMTSLDDKTVQDGLHQAQFDESVVKGGVDLIISCGGPLNNQVVSYDTAYANACDYLAMLAEGGAVIATGLTSLLLSKKNLESIGFRVENCVAAKRDQTISESTTYHPAYVMQKPEKGEAISEVGYPDGHCLPC
ncbi:hypothetical protein [Legionella taurinensis]|uniref:Methyltransferase domain-containing protein n=1 Tax=Legionella taurinensis TaxID=70611 RepID=A0A3A5L3X6_9GAMM|nr:hypothetical protein [Legionella taurinensis]RJT46936.1 hypothetical protein D6J04_07865 [Legionella taurinensis]RJT66863.1 hypothetical protein D6J03_09240 [Legionella taurinensis]STY25414.1 Uncharacterised protein [Legionella taurinensis]